MMSCAVGASAVPVAAADIGVAVDAVDDDSTVAFQSLKSSVDDRWSLRVKTRDVTVVLKLTEDWDDDVRGERRLQRQN